MKQHRAARLSTFGPPIAAKAGGPGHPPEGLRAGGAGVLRWALALALLFSFSCGAPRGEANEPASSPRIAALTTPATTLDGGTVDIAPDRQPFNLEWVMRSAVDAGIQPVRVAGLSTREWKCSFYRPSPQNPALSVHLFKPVRSELGAPVAIVSSNACWTPGDPFLVPQPGGLGQPRSMVVLRQVRGVWSIAAPRGPPFTKLGFATLYGNPWDAGEVGGGGIVLHPPTNPSLDVVDCIAARMPVAAFDRKTGEILTRENGLGSWFEHKLDRGDDSDAVRQGRTPIFRYPHFLRDPVFDPDAWAVKPHDSYHLSRAFMDALGAWREKRDPISRAYILVCAEEARVAWTLADLPVDPNWGKFSLKNSLAAARAAPGHGGYIVRGVAWPLRLFAAAIEVGAPNRAEFEAVIEGILEYWRAVQLPSGALYSAPFGYGLDQDQPWNTYGLAKNKSESTSWQNPFAIRAIWECQRQVPRLRPIAREIVLKCEKLWGPKTPRVPGEDNSPPGLPLYLVVAVDGVPVAEVTEGVGLARGYYDADAFAVFAEARQ